MDKDYLTDIIKSTGVGFACERVLTMLSRHSGQNRPTEHPMDVFFAKLAMEITANDIQRTRKPLRPKRTPKGMVTISAGVSLRCHAFYTVGFLLEIATGTQPIIEYRL